MTKLALIESEYGLCHCHCAWAVWAVVLRLGGYFASQTGGTIMIHETVVPNVESQVFTPNITCLHGSGIEPWPLAFQADARLSNPDTYFCV